MGSRDAAQDLSEGKQEELVSEYADERQAEPALAQIEEEAENRMESLLDSLNEKFPAPNKEKDPLAWAAHQNSLTAMAEEIVLKELVYN